MGKKGQTFSTDEKLVETAVLVALINRSQDADKAQEYLGELAFLASTKGIETKRTYTQALEKPDVRTFIGSGKLEEIKNYIEEEKINTLIFDDDLSPSQLRNVEKYLADLKVKIYDRSLLILDIFLIRAKTAQAKVQVELAHLQYLLPRLTRMWTHLERQRGGTSTRGGSGEKEIETDKRIIREQIVRLKEKLNKIEKQSETQRKGREVVARVALVGYTNVGKSTLMQLLSKANVFAENKLFATVDSTVRKVVMNNVPFLLSDTVGFIRKLPHSLIECFKSTLMEVREADLLLHVADLSNDSVQDHIAVVKSTLKEIDASDKETILVLNKIDLYEKKYLASLEEGEEADFQAHLDKLVQGFKDEITDKVICISAVEKININTFRKTLYDTVLAKHVAIYPNYLPQPFYG